MGEIFHRHAWDIVDKLAESYGGVCKINGMFGVRVQFPL